MRALNRRDLTKYLFYGFIPGKEIKFKVDYSQKLDWSEAKIKKEILRLLKRAVKKSLQTKNLPAVLLSGGLDSGMVAALMAEFISPTKINAFSLAFQEKESDESDYARLVARHLDIKHHVKFFTAGDGWKIIDHLPRILTKPIADPSLLPTCFIFDWVKKQGFAAAFLGDGGDEILAGYPKYLAHWFLEKTGLGKLPLNWLAGFFPKKQAAFWRYASQPLYRRNQFWISHFSPAAIKKLTGEDIDLGDLEKCHRLFDGVDPLDEAFFLDQNLTLPGLYLAKTRAASRLSGLRTLCPFLDEDLFSFSAQIPFELKLKGWRTKSLLKEIARDYLPREIIYRPKMGFGIPLGRWLATDWQKLIAKELGNTYPQLIKTGRPEQIWSLLVLQKWQREFR